MSAADIATTVEAPSADAGTAKPTATPKGTKAATGRKRGDTPTRNRKATGKLDALPGTAKQAARKTNLDTAQESNLQAAQKLADNEKVKDALRKARMSVNSDLTAEQRQRALTAPTNITGTTLAKHIMSNDTQPTQVKVSGKDAAAKVLRLHDGPMKISELSRTAVGHATHMKGKTPEQSIARDVLMDAKKTTGAIFIKVGKGLYDLVERNPQGTPPAAESETSN